MRTALLVMNFVQGLGAGICFDIAAVKLSTRGRRFVDGRCDYRAQDVSSATDTGTSWRNDQSVLKNIATYAGK